MAILRVVREVDTIIGGSFTSTFTEAVSVQPFTVSLPDTTYFIVPPTFGISKISVPVFPLFQVNSVADPPAVRNTVSPRQIVSGEALIVTVGLGIIVTSTLEVASHPRSDVAVTV